MTRRQKYYIRFIKRPIGFIGALVALIMLSPLFLIIILLLKVVNDGGSVFFTQERPGINEKIFRAVKFKTMTDARNAEGELLPDSERLTGVGKFIRSVSIDELPQLFNILMGDMAFIGPRPLLVKYLPLYSEEQRHRHDVIPGMSGWAQVNGRNGISWTQKFDYDVYYVHNISLVLDAKIFILTVRNVFGRKNINAEGQATIAPFTGDN